MPFSQYFRNNEDALSYTEKQVLNSIESFLKADKKLTIVAIADYNNVSTTTVVRMHKKLGFNGFPEFCQFIASLSLSSSETKTDTSGNFLPNFQETIHGTKLETLKTIASLIDHAGNLFICSLGLSTAAGNYLNLLLLQLGINCISITDPQVMRTIDHKAKPDDVFFILSNSGESLRLVELSERLLDKNITTISITNNGQNSLVRNAKIAVFAHSKTLKIDHADMTPHFPMVLLIDMIFQTYLNEYVFK